MDAVSALERLGGTASAGALLELTTRRKLRREVRRGRIEQPSRGRYLLPTMRAARREAERLTAVIGLRSAAAAHGWELKEQPELIVRRGRKIAPETRGEASLHWMNLAEDQVVDRVTTPLRTIIDCARNLPFDEALAIADSALRHGSVTREDLESIEVRGAGADAVRRVLRHAHGRALVFEADSWRFHTTRKAHRRDCARYNLLILRGWRVLRFTWEQVMHDQGYVRWVLTELTRSVERPEVGADVARTA